MVNKRILFLQKLQLDKLLKNKKNILICPLNWGLGHATRCIPIIKALLSEGYNPILASDGVALALLQKEFPDLTTIHLPSYNIMYPKKGKHFKWKMLTNGYKIIYAMLFERQATRKIVKKYAIDGIISDNRLGVFSSKVPCVFITHQLNVMTGNTTKITSWLHRQIIKKYKSCWVPDFEGMLNLTGNLGHPSIKMNQVVYIGPLSRLQKKEMPIIYDLMVILSGPEPQRTLLEELLIKELKGFKGKILFVKGKIEEKQTKLISEPFTFFNFMNATELEIAFNESNQVLCRSGYTTVMDLAFLEKRVFFIPTPGQYEQEYLANLYEKSQFAPTCTQEAFTLDKLEQINTYKGFPKIKNHTHWQSLFTVFEKQ